MDAKYTFTDSTEPHYSRCTCYSLFRLVLFARIVEALALFYNFVKKYGFELLITVSQGHFTY